MAYSADMNIYKAIEADPRVVDVLKKLGLKCVDRHGEPCVASEVENFADAAMYHEIPLEKILAELDRLGPPPPKA